MKTHKIKIIADINSIYSGDVEEIKDLILQIGDTGIDGITIDITKEGDDRVTKRELYIIKAFCDLAKFTLYPFIANTEKDNELLNEIGIDNFIYTDYDDYYNENGNIRIQSTEHNYPLFTADEYPINYSTFNYLNYIGFIDNSEGIYASIIALVKGAKYIIKGIGENEGRVGLDKIRELCYFRDAMERILGI